MECLDEESTVVFRTFALDFESGDAFSASFLKSSILGLLLGIF
jgi:hypothetical protein